MDITENEGEEGPSLPTQADEEFKPFIRRLPEFKFWYILLFYDMKYLYVRKIFSCVLITFN